MPFNHIYIKFENLLSEICILAGAGAMWPRNVLIGRLCGGKNGEILRKFSYRQREGNKKLINLGIHISSHTHIIRVRPERDGGRVHFQGWRSQIYVMAYSMLLWNQDTIAFMSTYMIHYRMSKKSWQNLYRNLRNKMGQDFLTVIHKTAKNVVLTNG